MARLVEDTWATSRSVREVLGLVARPFLLSLIAAFLLGFLWAALSDPAARAAIGF